MLLWQYRAIWSEETTQMIMITYADVLLLKMMDNDFLSRSRLRSYHQELLTILNEQVDEFIKHTKWRIGNDYVVIAIVNILESYTFPILWIIATNADGLDSPFFCFSQKIVDELILYQIHLFLNLCCCGCYFIFLNSSTLNEKVTIQHITFFFIDNLFIITLIPIAGAKYSFAT